MRIVLSTTNDDPAGACCPFGKDRNGFVFGEAEARGANILGRLIAASITSDDYHVVAPDSDGQRVDHARPGQSNLPG